jgi:hypothetical protein
MSFTYKLARRLAQVHLLVVSLATLSCTDHLAPSEAQSIETPGTAVTAAATTSLALVSTTGSAANPNEPTGLTPISDRGFLSKVENGWRDRGDPTFNIITDSTAPASPSPVGKAVYPAGFLGGTAPLNTWLDLQPKRTQVYASFWVKFSSNWTGHPSGMNKIMHFWIGGTNKVVFKAMGIGKNPLIASFHLQGVNHVPASYNLVSNTANAGTIVRGRWHHVEISVTANTGSRSDGKVTWWLDGQLIGNYTNCSFVTTSQGHQFTQVSWSPTWGGVGGTVPSAQDMQIDNIYVSAR